MTAATLRIREAAAYLGETEPALRARIARGTLPYRRLGGRIILLRAELDAYLAALPGVTLDQARDRLQERAGK